jgi:phytoene synthase
MAMRILPKEQRAAILAVYGFCRAVDDIADEPSPDAEWRRRQLESWRQAIGRLYAGEPVPELAELSGPVDRFGLRQADFDAVIEGMLMDADGGWLAPDWRRLDHYCDCVASAVGRLSVRIFGLDDADGVPLAHHLGRALQLTNILRDIDEDHAMGRLYLPREALEGVGISPGDAEAVLGHPRLTLACMEVAARAGGHFQQAEEIMQRCPRKAVRAPRLMASAYGTILRRLIATGWTAPRERIHTDRLRLAGAFLRYGLI